MRIALIADLHGNWPAIQTLEKDLQRQKVDQVICLGDMVGKGPSSDRTFDWAMANCAFVLGGNWDYGIGAKHFPNDHFYWNQMGPKRLDLLRALPREHTLLFGGRCIRLFHGRPLMDSLVTIHDPSEAITPFFTGKNEEHYDVVIYADTHRQALRTMMSGLFVNCGSVGNALGEPRCCYALLEGTQGGADDFELRFRQVHYDRAQAIEDARLTPAVPGIDLYIRELETGIYSRPTQTKG